MIILDSALFPNTSITRDRAYDLAAVQSEFS